MASRDGGTSPGPDATPAAPEPGEPSSATEADADVTAALFEAATAVLREDGIGRFDLDRIDQRAGLPPGTGRERFRTRGGLVAAMLEALATESQTALDAVMRRHPGDAVTALVDWIELQLGSAREPIRVMLAVMGDAGMRREIALYADALQTGWDRTTADRVHLDDDHMRITWLMVEGLIVLITLRDEPMPDRDTLTAQVRALLQNPR
jgi:AcrR family transcriptional regulator